jgi:hypothetical protein
MLYPNNGMGVFLTLECFSKEPELEAYLKPALCFPQPFHKINSSKSVKTIDKSSRGIRDRPVCGQRREESGTAGRAGRDER